MSNNESKHSPLPWSAKVLGDTSSHKGLTMLYDANGEEVPMPYGAMGRDNAYLTVESVNLRGEVTQFLEKLLADYADLDEHFRHSLHPEDVAAARALLGKVAVR